MNQSTKHQQPSTKRSVIGRWVRVKVTAHGQARICEAVVIDKVKGTNLAKRIRLQWPKEIQGEVVMRGQYEVMEFLD